MDEAARQQLEEATMETNLLKRLAGEPAMATAEQPSKWSKPEGKGRLNGGAKGGRTRPGKGSTDEREEGDAWLLRQVAQLVIRHEDALAVARLDRSFVFHFRVDGPGTLVKSLFTISQVWKDTKTRNPESLTLPLRSVIFQHVLKTVAERWESTMKDPNSMADAKKLGWLLEDHTVPYVLWDSANAKQVINDKHAPVALKTFLEIQM